MVGAGFKPAPTVNQPMTVGVGLKPTPMCVVAMNCIVNILLITFHCDFHRFTPNVKKL